MIIVDERFRVAGLDACDVSDVALLARKLDTLLAAGGEVVTVVGDDATLAAVATARHILLSHRAEPLDYVLLSAGEFGSVASTIDAGAVNKRSLARAEAIAKSKRRQPKRVASMRILDTSESLPFLGFGFAMGAVATWVADAGRLRRRDAVRDANPEPLDVDFSIDWEPSKETVSYLLASSLPQVWGGISMGEGLSLRSGRSAAALLGAKSRVGAFVGERAGLGARAATRIHIDGNSDYVVDGLTRQTLHPRTLDIQLGPQLRVLTV